MRAKEELLTAETTKAYFNALETHFRGAALTHDQQESLKEINIALEFNPELCEELLNIYLAPLTSTFSGLKMIFPDKENDSGTKGHSTYPSTQYTELEWKSIQNAAASSGKLYHSLQDKIVQLGLGRIEHGIDTRKFHIDMPLAQEVTLHLEVVRMGTQWLVIPFSSCTVIYNPSDGEEKIQTKFKSLRLKLEDLEAKGIFLESNNIVIKRAAPPNIVNVMPSATRGLF